MPSSNKYDATAWGGSTLTDLEVPSGQLCQVKKPNPRQLIAMKILDSFDQLSNLVDSKVKRVKGTPKPPSLNEADVQAVFSRNPEKIVELLETCDKVTEYMVVQPNVRRPVKLVDGQEVELSLEEREEGTVYTDQIDDIDKMFIFQYSVGGSADLATFREQIGQSTDSLANGKDVQDTAV